MKKYGRTFHFPMSPGATNDDKIMPSIKELMMPDLLVTEKMDDENTTIHCSGTHARSPDSRYHPSRDWMKRFAASISPYLEENERVVGENIFRTAFNSLRCTKLIFYGLQLDCWRRNSALGSYDHDNNSSRDHASPHSVSWAFQKRPFRRTCRFTQQVEAGRLRCAYRGGIS